MTAVKYKIKKGDKVIVVAGKNKGKAGEVLEIITAIGRARVSGVNVAKRHTKAGAGGAGGIIEVERSINISNLAVADPKDGKATKVGYKFLKDGKKVRFAKKSGEVIDS